MKRLATMIAIGAIALSGCGGCGDDETCDPIGQTGCDEGMVCELVQDADEPAWVSVKGIEKRLVGAVASEIRSIRPPEPYKGKGIKYEGEYIRRKAGKAAGSTS